jgi:hypothetical protein
MNQKRSFVMLTVMMLSMAALFATDTSLNWSLSVQQVTTDGTVLLNTKENITLQNNDQFTITVTPSKDAFCYIILQNADGTVSVLNSSKISAEVNATFPSEGSAYTVTPPSGTDKLHIIMSDTEQKDMQKNIDRLSSAKAGSSTYKKTSKKIISAIEKLKLQSTQLASKATKPAAVGAVTRNVKDDVITDSLDTTNTMAGASSDATLDDVAQPATTILATPEQFNYQNTYVKTIRLVH